VIAQGSPPVENSFWEVNGVFRRIFLSMLLVGVLGGIAQAQAAGGGAAMPPQAQDQAGWTSRTATNTLVYMPAIFMYWPPIPEAPVLELIDNGDYDGDYQVKWQAARRAEGYVLQEDDNPGFDSPATFTEQAELVHLFVNQPCTVMYCVYYYRVKGHNTMSPGWDGPWSNVVSTVVYAEPPAPVLNPIYNPSQAQPYVVSWLPVSTAESYLVEEATTTVFSDTRKVYRGSVPTYTVSGRGIGTYFYRAQAVNRRVSAWSNVVSTSVASLALLDDFNDPGTGWAKRRTSSPNLDLLTVSYDAGRLLTQLEDRFDFGIASPMVPAPPLPYSIRFRVKPVHTGNLHSYGLVFGGNVGTVCPVDRDNAGDPTGCFFHYYRLNVVYYGGGLRYDVQRIDSHAGGSKGRGKGIGETLMDYRDLPGVEDNWNTWEVRVSETGFTVFFNGKQKAQLTTTEYVREPAYGLFISTDEYNNALWQTDYFYVEPLPPAEFVTKGSPVSPQ
jgi:hypothetical protein